MVDSEYWYNKYLNNIKLKKLNEVLLYYKQYLFESKKEEINIIEKKQNNNENIIDNCLKDYQNAKKFNKRFPIINYLFEIKNITEKEMCNYVNEWEKLELLIKKNSSQEIDKNIKTKIVKYFDNKDNKNILLNIFQENDYKPFIEKIKKEINEIEDNDDNEESKSLNIGMEESISSNMIIIDSSNDSQIINGKSIHVNVKEKKEDSSSIIVESCYIQSERMNKSNQAISIKSKKEDNNTSQYFFNAIESDLLQIFKKSSLYTILDYSKTLVKFKYPQIIKKLSNNYYIVGGQETKIIIFNHLYEIFDIMKIKYSIYDIDEIDSNEKEAQILVCGENAAYILKINFGEENDQYISMKKYYYPDITFEKIIRLNKDSYIFTGINGTLFSNNTFSKKHIKKEFKIISNEPYKNGIQINKKIFAFISNNIYPTGHDNLMFYNMEKGKNIHTIKEYSFNPSINSLYLINIDEKNSYKYLLLCACKKYEYEQKNGILLVYMNLKNEYEFYHIFYETNEFEVYCFCHI